MKMIRTIITSIFEGAIKRFSGSGRAGETFKNREYMQHYGFTSRPLPGAEGILLMEGNKIYLISSDDRRYRIALEEGEVALYTDEGDYIHFKRNKEIHINTGNKLIINATNDAEVNTKNVTVNASVKAAVTTPLAEVNAAVSAKVVSPVVNLGLSAGHKALTNEDLITLYNSHTHPGDSGGTTGVPNQQAGSAHKTSEVKAT